MYRNNPARVQPGLALANLEDKQSKEDSPRANQGVKTFNNYSNRNNIGYNQGNAIVPSGKMETGARESRNKEDINPNKGNDSQQDTGLVSILKAFASDSTVHGISKSISPAIYPGRRFLWSLLVLAGTSALVTFTIREVQNYLAYDTYTVQKNTESLDLPAFTLCPLKAFEGSVLDLPNPLHRVVRSVGSLADLADPNTLLKTVTDAYKLVNKVTDANKLVNTVTGLNITDTLNALKNMLTSLTSDQDIMTKLRYPTSHLSQSSIQTAHLGILNVTRGTLGDFFSSPTSGETLKKWTLDSQVLKISNCPQPDNSFFTLSCCQNIFKDVLTEVGKCQTFDPSSLSEDNQILENVKKERKLLMALSLTQLDDLLLFNLQGLQLVVHEPGEKPLPLSRGVFVPADAVTSAYLKRTKKISLPPPYKSLVGVECTDTKVVDFENPLRRYPGGYTYESCRTECFINYTTATCGCRHPWYPPLSGDSDQERLCTISEVDNCVWKIKGDFANMSNSDLNCSCVTPCEAMEYELDVASDKNPSVTLNLLNLNSLTLDTSLTCHDALQVLSEKQKLLVLDVRFPAEMTETHQVERVTLMEMLASIGGLIGLMMGFSVLSLAEIIELAFLILRWWVNKMRCRKR